MKIIKITKSGYIYIFITIFIGFAAINTGNNLLYLLTSSLLGFMGISGFFGKRNIEDLQISLLFPDEIFANRSFWLKVNVKNKKRFLPSFIIKVKFKNFIIDIPFVNKLDSNTGRVLMKFEKRGIISIDEVYIFSPFPFNFFIRSKKYKLNEKIIVYPEPKKIELISFNENSKNQGFKETPNQGFSGDLIKIREYDESDPIKLIHWKLSCKYETLMVKVLSSEENKSIILDFEKINIANIETKISAITYIVIKNPDVILKIGKKLIKTRSEILKELALY